MNKTLLLCIVLYGFCQETLAITRTVCASGCNHTSIQNAIDAADPADVIEIQDAVHTEQGINVNKDLTIQGQGQTTTIVQANSIQALATGGVFTVAADVTMTFQDLTIRNGNATGGIDDGGGVYITGSAFTNVAFLRVTITSNGAVDDGGGVFISAPAASGATATFTDCVISDNAAGSISGSDGGGISNIGGDLTLERCTISGNTSGDDGGGIYMDESSSAGQFINCTIYNNSNTGGGSVINGTGVCIENASSSEFVNCTIVNNSLGSSGTRRGGGIYWRSGSLKLTNTIVYDNTGASNAGENDIFDDGVGTLTDVTSVAGGCTNCPANTLDDTDPDLAAAATCGSQTVFGAQADGVALNAGTAPGSNNIPSTDICGETKLSPYDIGSVDFAAFLPVELIFFKGQNTKEGNHLTWETAVEINNEGFELQHSTNGIQWRKLDFIKGYGTTQETRMYSYVDLHPLKGVNYYRLKQIDYDGQFEYSNIISITSKGSDLSKLSVYPNPVLNDELSIFLPASLLDGGVLTVYNVTGQAVAQKVIQDSIEKIDVSKLPAGLYQIIGVKGMLVFHEKLVVK